VSDDVRDLIDAPDEAEGRERARALIAAGRERELVETALGEVGSGDAWRRERALAWFDELPGVDPLLEPLIDALRDTSQVERRNAARSILARLGSSGRASARLAELAATDADRDVRILAASALGESHDARGGLDSLLAATHDEDTNVVGTAVEALGALGDPAALPRLIELADRGDHWVRAAAVVALGRLEDAAAVPVLVRALHEPMLAELAADALARVGDPGAVDALEPLITAGDDAARRRALEAAVALVAQRTERPVPAWLRSAAASLLDGEGKGEPSETDMLRRARLLGVAGTAQAAEELVAHAESSERWPEVVVGLELLPPALVARTVLDALDRVAPETAARLLGALPALTEPRHVERLVGRLEGTDEPLSQAIESVLLRADRALALEVLDRQGTDGSPARRLAAARVLARLDSSQCDALVRLLDDDLPDVRRAAARGLGACDAAAVRDAVVAALDRERTPEVRLALIEALGAAGGPEAVVRLRQMVDAEEEPVRFAAARALGRTGQADALPELVRLLDDASESVRHAALRALGDLGDPRAGESVASRLGAPDRQLRRSAAGALERVASPRVRQLLLDALDDADWQVRLSAVRALAMLGVGGEEGERASESEARTRLLGLAESDHDPLVRREARRAAGDPPTAD